MSYFPNSLLRSVAIIAGLFALVTVRGAEAPARLPRLVDLGAEKCIPCKMMVSVLAGLTRDYAGRLEVEFIDVWKNRAKSREYGIRIIPTQIFFDGTGRELYRHEGFMAGKEIIAKWAELGVPLTVATKPN